MLEGFDRQGFYKNYNILFSVLGFESCELHDGRVGVCKNIKSCPYALSLLKKKINPQICGFEDRDPIVCCCEDASDVSEAPEVPAKIEKRRKPGEISLKSKFSNLSSQILGLLNNEICNNLLLRHLSSFFKIVRTRNFF